MLFIKNGRVLTMAGREFERGYIAVGGDGRLAGIGPVSGLDTGSVSDGGGDVKVIDAEGCYVLPGFIDAHCHLGLWEDATGFEGEDGNEATDPVTPHLRAIDGIYHSDRAFTEARENGITVVVTGPGSANVIGGQFAAIKTFGRCVDEMILKEPVALKVAFGENPKSVYFEKKQMPTTRMATAAILRENLMKAREYAAKLERYSNEPEESRDYKDKPEYDMKMEAMLLVLNGSIPLKAHAHRADDILTAIRIAKEFGVRLTIEHCTEGYLIKDILLKEGIPAIVGPLLTDRSKVELKNQSLKAPGILSSAGIKVAIMTDHPCVPIQYLPLCAAMAVREGMDPYMAMQAITINAAEITGIADRVGSLETGKDADIIICDGHPLDLKSRVQMTIINGRIVYDKNKDAVN